MTAWRLSSAERVRRCFCGKPKSFSLLEAAGGTPNQAITTGLDRQCYYLSRIMVQSSHVNPRAAVQRKNVCGAGNPAAPPPSDDPYYCCLHSGGFSPESVTGLAASSPSCSRHQSRRPPSGCRQSRRLHSGPTTAMRKLIEIIKPAMRAMHGCVGQFRPSSERPARIS